MTNPTPEVKDGWPAPWERDDVLELAWQAFGGKWDDCRAKLGYTEDSILADPYFVAEKARAVGISEAAIERYQRSHRYKICLAEVLRVVWPELEAYALSERTKP